MVNISFSPGLVPVLKHQSGKHDQKTHGRRMGGRGSFFSEFRDEAVSVLGLSSDMQIFDTNSDGTMSYHAKNADSSELKKAVAKRLADNMSSSTMDMLPTDADLDPSLDEYARKTAAGALISQWAATSNDRSDVALAIQMAAREEFNLTAAASWPQSASRGSNGMEIDPSSPQGILNRKVQKRYEQDGAVYRDFVRTQYDLTQEMFNRRGITEVTVYRGFNDKETMESRKLGDPKISSINTRPLSSWSLDPNTAMEFAEEQNGLVVKSVIRTDQILATPVTGVGCWAESEIVTVSTYIDGEVIPQWQATERMNQDWDSDGFSDYETVTLPPLLKAAMSSIIEIDNNDSNADWIKSLRWDLPTDPDELERLFGYGWRERMESLPVWLAAPDSVKNGLSKHLGSKHDQKTHGTWAGGSSESGLDAMPYEWKPEFKERRTAPVLGSKELNLGREQLKQVADAPIAINLDGGELNNIVGLGRFKTLEEQLDLKNMEDYREARQDLEVGLWGVPEEDIGPIYGYFDTPLQPSVFNETRRYGEVIVVLKDSVAGRTTITAGDSANHGLTPVLVADARKGNLSLEQVDSAYLSRPFQRGETSVFQPVDSVRTIESISYFEAQIHGKVSLSDIKSVNIRNQSYYSPPVSESSIKILKENGIEVIGDDK